MTIPRSELSNDDKIIFLQQQRLIIFPDDNEVLISVNALTSRHQLLLSHAELIPISFASDNRTFIALVIEDVDPSHLVSYRALLSAIPPSDAMMVSRALQLITWTQQHQYCGQCGQKNQLNRTEHAMHCEQCHLFFYPKIAPCMMCLITKGDYCLLAQHQKHPNGFYSTLAGFVEAGESVEQTVHREVEEEVGLTVDHLSYFTSQSWPFPHQLMLGYFAEYESGDIVLQEEEIIDAQWFHYQQLPATPPPESLSGMMIDAFVTRQTSRL